MGTKPEVTIYQSGDDAGTWVVQIDTDTAHDVPELRVWVNDALVSDRDRCSDFSAEAAR